MSPQRLSTRRLRRRFAALLGVLGLVLWVAAVTLRVTPSDARDVAFPHLAARLLAIVTGGAAVAGGIVLLATG